MQKETLICEMCAVQWQRKIARGRKPRLCPQCIKENIVQAETITIMSSVEGTKQRSATRWQCPSCDEGITVFINLTYPPVCKNKAKHSTKNFEMQKVTRKKEAFAQ